MTSAFSLGIALLASQVRGQNTVLFPSERMQWGEPMGAFAIGDLDLDGIPDLALCGRTCSADFSQCWEGIVVRFGRSHRTFSEPQFHQAGSQVFQSPPAVQGTQILETTGDGWPDIAFLDTVAREIVVLPSLGGGALGTAVTSACTETTDPISGVDFGDLDGDGITDAVVALWTQGPSTCKCLQLLHGTGHGTFEQTETLFMGAALSPPKI